MVTFTVEHKEASARTGVLTTSRTPIQTPAVLLHTKDGNPPYMTPDLLQDIKEAHAMHISISDVVELREVLTRFGQGAHKDPMSFVDCPAAQEDSITVTPRKGNTKLTPQHYRQLIEHAKFDMFTPFFFDTTWDASKKRTRKAVDLALNWLDSLLQNLTEEEKKGLFGVVEGSGAMDMRIRSAVETAKRPVAGFVLGGLDVGEAPEARIPVVKAVLEKLPLEKPKMVIGPGSPEEVLELVAQGVDLFSTAYPYLITELGFALTFNINTQQEKARPRKLNVRDSVYVIDKRPLIEGCTCFACKNHTRSYIHHLFNVNEMLGEVLLQIHNTHHYLEFFKAIRHHIQQGSFSGFKTVFLNSLQTHLPLVNP